MLRGVHPLPTTCPTCAAPAVITGLACDVCGTAIEGRFTLGSLGRLRREQLGFVEVFLRCRGKIKDVEPRLGLSYPTVVARLDQVIAALDAPPPEPPTDDPRRDRRRAILDDLAAGTLDADEAARQLRAASRKDG